MVKNLPANAGDIRDTGWIPGLRRSPGGGHGNPLQYSCLENPTDSGARQATVHRVAKSQTRLKRLSMHTHNTLIFGLPSWSSGYDCTPKAGGTGLIPGQGTKIPHALWWGQKEKKQTQPLCISIIVVTWFAHDQIQQSFPLQFILFVS